MGSPRIVVAGRGHIGEYIIAALRRDGRTVEGYDIVDGYDLADPATLQRIIDGAHVVIDTLPYQFNRGVAKCAAERDIAYFNLTEDVGNTEYIRGLSSKAPLIPQCGLAPGMVSIIAHAMAQRFSSVDTIRIRVGALPVQQTNHLGYALTWNPAGLINEYCNPCEIIQDGHILRVPALDGHESVTIDGIQFEAAYTSGGIGSLTETWENRARIVDYKTLRYPGHFAFMRVLRDDLQLGAHKNLAEDWFTQALPRTTEDMVVIQIHVTGILPQIHPSRIYTHTYSRLIRHDEPVAVGVPHSSSTAIQRTTAHGVLAVVDAYLFRQSFARRGFIRQEELPYTVICMSPYSRIYRLP